MTNSNKINADRYSIAPMVDVTDSTFRQIARLFTKRAMLYTEMIAADAIVHEKYHLLAYDATELPVTLQLGGNDEKKLAYACKKAQQLGYSAINLNAGCPSDKVACGQFGAILMHDPKKIASLYQAMQESVDIPVSVKTRIGVDDKDSFDFTYELVNTIYNSGCRHIVLHARKAWLNGLSPKENRTIPPLDYERVYTLKNMFKDLNITINGGILTIDEIKTHLTQVDGVMQGRAIIDNIYILASIDKEIFLDKSEIKSREQLLYEAYELYQNKFKGKVAIHHFARHLFSLFAMQKNSKIFRRYLSNHMHELGADGSVLLDAYKAMINT